MKGYEHDRRIGAIGNHYGELYVGRSSDGTCNWGISDNGETYDWEEIPESLYRELIKFEESQNDQTVTICD